MTSDPWEPLARSDSVAPSTQLDEGSSNFEVYRPAEISLDQSVELEKISEKLVMEFPEVASSFSILGTAEIAADPMGINQADLYVMYKDKKDWPLVDGRRRTKIEVAEAIKERLENEVPGQKQSLSQPIQMRFNELLEGTKADVTVKVFGEDLDQLTEVTRKIADAVKKVRGAGDVDVERRGKSPMLRIYPKAEMLNRLGVSTDEVLETVGTAIGGEDTGYLYEGTRRYPIVVRLAEGKRSDLEALRTLPVGIAANATVPLGEAATLKFEDAYGSIFREQSKRRAAVMVNIRGRDTESFVNEAKSLVESSIKMPPGYYAEWGGNFRNLQEARSRLLLLTPIALALVLILIYAAFGSLYQTILIFSCIPLSLVGGVIALLVRGMPFSISAGIGFIALCGIAVLNGVVLVNYYNQLRRTGMSGSSLFTKGALLRLRPVLMTALVDVFGFLPMMLSASEGAEVQRPLATVVVGGVISSTALTLLLLPVLYSLFEKKLSE